MQVPAMVMCQGFVLVILGAVAGIAGSLALSRVLSGFLYGISSSDPATYAAVTAIIVVAGALACYLPARSILKRDPAQVLSE